MATAHGPIRLSASQVKMFEDCQMKWFLAYIEKIKAPSTEAMIFGSCFHMVVEYYIRTKGKEEKDWDTLKTMFIKRFVPADDEYELKKAMELNCSAADFKRITRLLQNGKKKLGPWITQENVEVELEIVGPVLEDVTYIGYIDLLLVNHAAKEIFVFDHKTTSDFKYCETVYTLPKDIQVGMYCYHIMKTRPELADYSLYVGHIQYLKKSPNNVQSVKAVMPQTQIDTTWDRVTEVGAKMLMTKEAYTDNWVQACQNVPRNLGHCNKYRTKTSPGCAFNPICHGGMSPQRLKENFQLEKKAVENMNRPISPLVGATAKTQETFKSKMEEAPVPEVSTAAVAAAAPVAAPANPGVPVLDLTMYNVDVPNQAAWEKVRYIAGKDITNKYYDMARDVFRDITKYALAELGQDIRPTLDSIVNNGNKLTAKEKGRKSHTFYKASKQALVAYPNLATSAFAEAANLPDLQIFKAQEEAKAEVPTSPADLDPAVETTAAPVAPAAQPPAGFSAGAPETQPPVQSQPMEDLQPKQAEEPKTEIYEAPVAPEALKEQLRKDREVVKEQLAKKAVEIVEKQLAPPVQNAAPNFAEHLILVNCHSAQLAPQSLSKCYADAEEKLAAQYELADVRCHQYNEPVKQMLGYLGSVIENCLKYPIITANANDPVDAILIDALERKGFTVIRGSK